MAQLFTVHPDNPQQRLLRQAAELLQRGSVLAVPTDSCYALVCQLDDKAAVDALSGLDRENPGEKYKDVDQMYKEANYRYADQLYAEKKPYEALVYYRNILDYKDVSTRKLKRASYEIIGTWESNRGAVFIFRDDGTCSMEGKEMFYFAQGYTLQVGDRPGELDMPWRIVDLRPKSLSLRNSQTQRQYKCVRVED